MESNPFVLDEVVTVLPLQLPPYLIRFNPSR